VYVVVVACSGVSKYNNIYYTMFFCGDFVITVWLCCYYDNILVNWWDELVVLLIMCC
jgi:hypothetical protein